MIQPAKTLLNLLTLTVSVQIGAAGARAQEWPQWRGPGRDGHAPAFVAPEVWPEQLARRWRTEVGAGYSSPVVAGGRVYVHTREGDEEIVSSLALGDGKLLWSARYAAPYTKNSYALKHGKGPNSTPAVVGGKLYTLGMSGILSAFDAASGKLLWRHDHSDRVTTEKLFCGTSASPLVDRGRVFVHLGDDRAGELVAFDAESGAVEWSWKGTGPGYASPVAVDIAGRRQVVTLTQSSVVGLDARDGRLLWQIGFEDEWNENIVTPVFDGDVLVVAGVRKGTLARRIRHVDGTWTVEDVWTRSDLPQYMSSPVVDGDVLYGLSSRQKGQLFVLDLGNGKTLWEGEGRQAQHASVLAAGKEHLMVLTDAAELVVVGRGPDALAPVASYRLADSATWAHPALWQGNILVKDATAVTLWSFQ